MQINSYMLTGLLILAGFFGSVQAQTVDEKIADGVSASLVEQDLHTAHPVFLQQMKAAPEKREEYVKRLYFNEQLRKRVEASGLDKTHDVIAALKRARIKIYLEALVRNELEKENADVMALAKERYDANPEAFKTRAKSKFSVIFMRKGKTEEENAKVKQQMEDILAQLKDAPGNVKLFADLAKKYSQDRFASNGGLNRKWVIAPKNLERAPKLVQAAFALDKPAQISDIIENSQGYSIFMLMSHTPAEQVLFDDAKETLVTAIQEELWRVKEAEITQSLTAPEEMDVDVDRVEQLILEEEKKRESEQDTK